LKPEMVRQMADRPLIFALANPTPEIMPEEAKAARPDAVLADRTFRLPQPGQQRAVFSLHLSPARWMWARPLSMKR